MVLIYYFLQAKKRIKLKEMGKLWKLQKKQVYFILIMLLEKQGFDPLEQAAEKQPTNLGNQSFCRYSQF